MDIEKLREELKRDEGCVYSVYLDHLNLPTTGIGHLVTEWDEEYGKPVGTKVSEDRVNELFAKDIQVTIDECKLLYSDFDDMPEDRMNPLMHWCGSTSMRMRTYSDKLLT